MCELKSQWEELRGLVGGITEHDTLVTSTELLKSLIVVKTLGDLGDCSSIATRTLFLNPVGWTGALLGVLLFRLVDVIKPYPADRLEKLHGGVGVMADDGMAAVYANLVLRACLVPRRASSVRPL